LPLHQGWVKPGKTAPGKFANAELMKIPNFLHLTPPAIKRQCEALKSNHIYLTHSIGHYILCHFH
jgi:small subunit ribosomal protein S35